MAGGSAAKSRPMDCWTLSIASVDRWLKNSQTGDTLIYAHGPTIIDQALAEHMTRLAAAKEVHLHPRRSTDGGLDRVAVRNRVRVALPSRQRPTAAAALDPAMAALLLKLKHCAREGARCQSDKALGASLGLTADQVKWAMKKLKTAGLIQTRIVATPSDAKFRVVTIVATGFETALPKGELR